MDHSVKLLKPEKS